MTADSVTPSGVLLEQAGCAPNQSKPTRNPAPQKRRGTGNRAAPHRRYAKVKEVKIPRRGGRFSWGHSPHG